MVYWFVDVPFFLNTTKAMLLLPKQNKSRVVMSEQNKNLIVNAGRKQKTCCWCPNQTKAILLSDQNKIHVVDAGTKQRPCRWCRNKTNALFRGERSIETIASLVQRSMAIENHWNQWLNDHEPSKNHLKQWSGGWKSVNGDGHVTQKALKTHWKQ